MYATARETLRIGEEIDVRSFPDVSDQFSTGLRTATMPTRRQTSLDWNGRSPEMQGRIR